MSLRIQIHQFFLKIQFLMGLIIFSNGCKLVVYLFPPFLCLSFAWPLFSQMSVDPYNFFLIENLFLSSKGIIEGRFSLRENQLQNLGIIINLPFEGVKN